MATKRHYQVEFAIKPHAIQQEIVDHIDGKYLNREGKRFRFFVVVCGRQWGKSFIAKYTLMKQAINEGKTCMWVAPSIPTARGHWRGLVNLIQKSNIPTVSISMSDKEIHFHGGGSISVRSALEPDNLRGATLDFLVLDEAAYFRNGDYVWYSVCQPMITASGGSVLFVTTPHGKNWVYDVWLRGTKETDKYYRSWRAPSTTSPYQDATLLEDIRTSIPEYKWKEEYLAEFLSDAGGVFNGIDDAAIVEPLEKPIPGHMYVCGVDIGKSGDPTRITMIDKYTREQVYGDGWVSLGTIPSMRRIGEILDIWKPEITLFEKNGIGETFFDIAKAVLAGNVPDNYLLSQMYPDEEVADENEGTARDRTIAGHHLRAVHMNNDLKRGFVERLTAAIEWGKLAILKEDSTYGKVQIAEMSTYERQATKSGTSVTYNAADGYHDDTVSALYLAYSLVPAKLQVVNEKQEKQLANPFRSGKHLKAGKKRA